MIGDSIIRHYAIQDSYGVSLNGVLKMDLMSFLTLVVFAFALMMVLAGVFTAYFGTGKSRKVGLILLLVGLVIGLVWAYLVGYSNIEMFAEVNAIEVAVDAIINFFGILIGALIGVGIFLVAVMKS